MFQSTLYRSAMVLQTSHVKKSPWYEIWLFKTKVRFRRPRRYGRLPKGPIYVSRDERPFYNTERKDRYYHADGKYSLAEIYRGYWPIGRGKWFAPAKAVLELNLRAVDVWKEDIDQFPDLYDQACGRAWVKRLHNHFLNDPGMVTFVAQGDGLFEIKFNDEDGTPVPVKEHEFHVEVMNFNGHPAYQLSPEPHRLDFVVPFSKAESLCFSFTLQAVQGLTEEESQAALQAASEFAYDLVESLSITYPPCRPVPARAAVYQQVTAN